MRPGDRLRDDARDGGVVGAGVGDLQALLERVGAERGDDLLARAGERALGQVVADQVDRGDERLGLDRQQARRAVEVVGVRLGVDLDRAVVVDLGVEDVGAAAEVHDVEDVDVLAQLGLGDLDRLADVGELQALAGAAGVDQDRRERDEPGEALGPDRGVAAPRVVVLALGGRARRGRRPAWRAPARPRGAPRSARSAPRPRRRGRRGRRRARARRARARTR